MLILGPLLIHHDPVRYEEIEVCDAWQLAVHRRKSSYGDVTN